MKIYKLLTVKFDAQNLPEKPINEELCLSVTALCKRLSSYGPENGTIYAADLQKWVELTPARLLQVLEEVEATIGENYMPRVDINVTFLGGLMEPVKMSFLIATTELYA